MTATHENGRAQPKTPLTYLWGGLALLTCPCHIGVLALVLSGTTLGAFLSEHLGTALFGSTILVFVFIAAALRSSEDSE